MGSKPSVDTKGSSERRLEQRFDLRMPIDYESCGTQSKGLLWDISTTGARIEETSQPELGTEIKLTLAFFPGATPVALRAEVVRHTESGFAAKFHHLDQRTRKLLSVALPRAAAFAAKQ